MGRCVAPCTGKVSGTEYRALVRCAEWVLDGNVKGTREKLALEMEEAAENMEFERAAAIRDSIFALEKLCEKQKVVADEKVNRDVFAMYTSETEGVLAVLSIRSGALVNKNEFILSLSELTSGEDAISVIADYYDGVGNIPREVMLDFELEEDDISLLSEYLSLGTKYKVNVKIPSRGDGRALCDLALENAKEAGRQYRLSAEREDKDVKRLAELLDLPASPKRIEAYDISNIGDESIVASMVVYEDGKLKKSDYRLFNIKTTAGRDDYGSMREALSRRLSHIGDGTLSLGAVPDLILLDGGVGQVGAVREILEKKEIDIPLFGMVKDDYHKTRAITDGKREISIAHELNVYAFIYKIQEEAHRFAVKASSGGKIKTMTKSTLEKIDGIGPKKAKLLLSQKKLSEIRQMSREELGGLNGISEKDAENIYKYYHKGEV
jgi:excinuclease ABC subunit C